MSSPQDSTATIVCREVFDETSDPSNEEVIEYARRLGIDPDAEPHLLDLAREGLMAALPKGWVPCFHEVSQAWYYYEQLSGTTSWVHPLDAVYKELVEQARAGNRQMSVEDDSKTTAKDLESHEEASISKETAAPTKDQVSKISITPTKIPQKLAPLRKTDGPKKKDGGDRIYARRESDSRSDMMSLASDRASRDYTNLRFQDPKFYECPKLLESVSSSSNNQAANNAADNSSPPPTEIDLREVLKRSESLSPRHEKDWEQLSSKFSSEENIIDIDKLSASTLARSERPEKFDKEKHPSQLGQQKELTLSGGGSMFLKSNRSRDTTPSQEGGKIADFRTQLVVSDDASNVSGDRLKSILREKQSEDDDRPVDEERKSVRFDLEKEADIKFTYSGSENECETDTEDQNVRISMMLNEWLTTDWAAQRSNFDNADNDDENDDEDDEDDEDEDEDVKNEDSDEKDEDETVDKNVPTVDKIDLPPKNSKIVGKRFVVQNVTEKEHRSQIVNKVKGNDGSMEYVPNKFDKFIAKNEAEVMIRRSDSDEHRKTRTMEKGRRASFGKSRNHDDNESPDGSRNNLDQDVPRHVRHGKPKLTYSRSFEDVKMNLSVEHEKEVASMKEELKVKLDQTKAELEKNFAQEKIALQQGLDERLEELKREMAEKEEQEIQKLIAEMDEARMENLKKVRVELEVCYEKERQEILANLKTELDERKKELLELRNQEIGKLENEHERDLGEEKLAKMNEFELNRQHSEKIEAMKKELDKEFDDLRTELRLQQREKITKITEEHEKCLAEILRDFRIDEGLARKMYKQRLEEIRADFSRDAEKEARKQSERALQQDSIDFEKMRCEKRLLQDKYSALKEKYMKLKNDVRLAVERRSKRKEGYTTASETERSASTRTRTERTESSEQNTPLRNTRSGSITNHQAKQADIQANAGTDQSQGQSETEDTTTKNSRTTSAVFPKSAITGGSSNAAKFESDDTTTASETNANMMRRRKSFTKKAATGAAKINDPGVGIGTGIGSGFGTGVGTGTGTGTAAGIGIGTNPAAAAANNNNNNIENPVENIRKQLEKLEDIGDQLPSNETAYTLRYPFQDKAPANASSELEFFRHRIHVERDSVRRAKEALRQQRNVYQGRVRAWEERSTRATLEQLVQGQRELSDMEVSLHRTKSLLGEKVIHLKHLEQSLERVANFGSTRNDELTLSDMSSASSGFSSTDLGTDTFVDKLDHNQESTEIIASLENLNSEIREIWGVLNKRQDANMPPPSTMMYSYLRWLRFYHLTTHPNNIQGSSPGTPNIQSNILSQLTATQPPATTTQNIIAQYGPNSGFTTSVGTVERSASNLMERSRNLRDWLRQARAESTDLVSPGQATL